jgi:hypothetical protein
MGTGFGRAYGTWRTPIQIYMSSNQVDGNRAPAVGDGVTLPVNLDGTGRGEAAEIEFLEERK